MNTPEKNEIYQFPPLHLLNRGQNKIFDSDAIKETALIIQQTLQKFGIRISIIDITIGARFTRYEIQPEQGIRVRDIISRENEIRIAIGAKSIYIEAPIQGKCTIGISVLNIYNTVVTIREIIESEIFQKSVSNLTFAVGRDIAGNIVLSDIAKMRHLLISGTTGSGKTTCVDSIIMSILYKANPSDVKLVMIDTKIVNMSLYNGIPHLLMPVVTDAKKACTALNWCVMEMNDRYHKFAEIGVKNLKGYNKAIETGITTLDGSLLNRIPQILVIIDDLYDMIAVNAKEVQEFIVRLTQSSSATGIHLIISTQRPSTDVITGAIKANISNRIAFRTVSAIDSRVILDESGAEKLLGNGDMLFKSQECVQLTRIQGTYVSDAEISDVVDFLRNQKMANVYAEEIEEKITNFKGCYFYEKNNADYKIDEYFVEAGRFVIKHDKASIGVIQRVFRIGFNRAARIMDELYNASVVGEDEGTKPRRILMTMVEFENLLKNNTNHG